MRRIQFILITLIGLIVISYQNCDRVKFEKSTVKTAEVVRCEAGENGSALCAEKTVYFIGGVAQVFGDSSNAEDDSGEIILRHPFNGKNARVKVLVSEDGSIEVHPSEGYYPWACFDHTQHKDVLLQHIDSQGNLGQIVSNCYSPIRWYTDDGQQGFAKDIYGVAEEAQKNSTGEVYCRAQPDENGIYITNMVLAPPDRLNKDGTPKNLVWVRNPTPLVNFMTYFTTLYSGAFPYPESSTHLKVYEYKWDPSNGSAWTDLLIENTPQQLSQAAGEGYFP